MKKDIFVFIIFFLVTLLLLKDLSHSFYQQDEWHTLGTLRTERLSYLLSGPSPVGLLLLENRPLARLTNMIFFGQFPLNTFPLFLFSIIMHTLNAFLIYKIASHMIKNRPLVVLGTLFFIFNASSKQALLWFGTSTATLPAAGFIFLSIFLYIRFIEIRKIRNLIGSMVSLFISLGFKENALFLFLFFPCIDIFYRVIKRKKIKVSRFSLFFLSFGILLYISKFLSLFTTVTSNTRYIGSGTSGGFIKLIWAMITYPLESFSQIIVPAEMSFPISRKITEVVFPYFESTGYSALISELIVVEFISLLATVLFILPILFFLFTRKNKWPIIFTLLFYILSFVPLIVLVKPNGYLESRYYYIPAAAIGIFLGICLDNVLKATSKITSNKIFSIPIYIVILGLYALLLYKHATFIHDQLNFLNERSATQKYILLEILREHPRLSQRQVFYVESDHSFIAPNNPLPFQNGIGYTLLVTYVYKNNSKEFNQFLTDNYFWLLGSQGYKVHGKTGFGFFTDKNTMKTELRKGSFAKSDIVAFHYDSVQNKIVNITTDLQNQLD